MVNNIKYYETHRKKMSAINRSINPVSLERLEKKYIGRITHSFQKSLMQGVVKKMNQPLFSGVWRPQISIHYIQKLSA